MNIRNLLLSSSLLALAAGSAQAALVTFDLTAPQFTTFPSGETIMSNLGTTATLRAFASSGNETDGTRDVYGSGVIAGNAPDGSGLVAVFGCAPNGVNCSSLRFFFDDLVTLVSAEVNLLFSQPGNLVVTSDTNNEFFTTLGSGGFPPTVETINFTGGQFPRAQETELAFTGTDPGSISLRSITVDDPSASVPLPATLPLVAAGILGIGALRRRKPATI